jgi:hypothetical protein
MDEYDEVFGYSSNGGSRDSFPLMNAGGWNLQSVAPGRVPGISGQFYECDFHASISDVIDTAARLARDTEGYVDLSFRSCRFGQGTSSPGGGGNRSKPVCTSSLSDIAPSLRSIPAVSNARVVPAYSCGTTASAYAFRLNATPHLSDSYKRSRMSRLTRWLTSKWAICVYVVFILAIILIWINP